MRLVDRVLVVAFAVASLLIVPAWAGDIAISGFVNYEVTTSKSESVVRQRLTGKIEAADPTSILNGSDQECMEKDKVGAEQIVGYGYCDAVDATGDTWWLTFAADAAGSRWRVVGGTGKYAGMTGSGTTFFTPESTIAAATAEPPTHWRQGYEGKINLPSE